MIATITDCARCGGYHKEMQFVALGNNCGDWTHYGTCPVNRQPVLVRVVLENSATQSPIAALVTAAADAVYLRISEDVRTGGPVCREVLNRGVLCRMIVTLSLIGGAAGGLLIRYGKRAARAARALFCRHVTVSVKTIGAAAFSENGDVELTTQMTCDACEESWIASLAAGEALRLGMRT